jgi:ATP-dependent Clp protease adaptor protein ClpS
MGFYPDLRCISITFLKDNYLWEMKGSEKISPFEIDDVLVDTTDPFHLIVWNDEVNTFEWVIESLMEVCDHSYEQAEQCAYIIHYKGKYAVKHGSYENLKPMCDAITERGIGATLEIVPA